MTNILVIVSESDVELLKRLTHAVLACMLTFLLSNKEDVTFIPVAVFIAAVNLIANFQILKPIPACSVLSNRSNFI
jgi:hypothetical protein